MSDPNLVTTCTFNNRDYFVKMHVSHTNLELVVTDKTSGEDWQCCYDSAYIENITQKTGNFKQFNIFTAMLKSGLLKTSNSVYLDLMTFDDLDALRNHRIRGPYSVYHSSQSNNNRRYLILTYTVEFDRIHYPLPLEYCGPPDPKILQQNIVKLEEEVVQLKQQIRGGANKHDSRTILTLQKKIDDLNDSNMELHNENVRLSNILERKSKNNNYILMLQNAIKNLEQSVISERKSHHKLVEKLRKDKMNLSKELDKTKQSERELMYRLQHTKHSPRSRPIRRRSDTGAGDSRSPSPRIITKTNSLDTQMPTNKPKSLHRSPRKHRNNSSDSESGRESHLMKPGSSANKPNRNIKTETQTQTQTFSRTISPSSRSSSGSRSSRHQIARSREVTPQRTISRASELDFTSLENRIVALQKMLQKGLHIT